MMKTILFILTAMFTMTFASCGNKTSKTVDSKDTVTVDSVIETDSIVVDTVLVVEDSVKVTE